MFELTTQTKAFCPLAKDCLWMSYKQCKLCLEHLRRCTEKRVGVKEIVTLYTKL
jgi:hypothetical protein